MSLTYRLVCSVAVIGLAVVPRARRDLAAGVAFDCLDLQPLFLKESRCLYETTGEVLFVVR
jgi:hypothetical protein